ncbi:uncharacterized protein LOC121656375 [Melanotaenia boesemani]|uniref:uncharacterized protein LOC121656375 n=1 Tax=Melanotaenia boesemani TaxID=1250792 RepID=UPI001C058D31|nr:uncharacterized protein LOC121656375 [Melanotaenia boesemani]
MRVLINKVVYLKTLDLPKAQVELMPTVQYGQASHEGHNFGSGVVSSGAIEIIDTVEPSQQQPGPSSAFQYGTLNLPSPHGGDGVKSGNGLYRVPGMYYSSKPSHEGPGSNPHIKWDAPLGSTQSSHNLNKQMTGPRPVAAGYSTIRQQSGQQANPVQQPASSSGHIPQTKAGMWNLPSPHSGDGVRSGNGLNRVPGMYSSSKPSHEGPGSNPHIKWDAPLGSTQSSHNLNKQTGPRPVASGYSTIRQQSGQQANPVQWQPSLPAKPQPATSDVHILQTNAGMWDLPAPFSAKKQLSATQVNTLPKPYQKQPGSLKTIVQQVKGGVRDDAPRSSRRLNVETQNSKPVPVASLYNYEGQRPQLRSMHNRNRQPLAL